MSFEINTGTLVIGALIFIIGVFIKPMIMVLRDRMVWWYIEKYIVNDQLYKDIRKYAVIQLLETPRLLIDNYLKQDKETDEHKYTSQGGTEYVINQDDFARIRQIAIEENNWVSNQRIEFAKKSSLYDSLIKHYVQEKSNPIDSAIDKALEDYKYQHNQEYQIDSCVLTILADVTKLDVLDETISAYEK